MPLMNRCCGRETATTEDIVNNYQYDSDASKKSERKLMSSMDDNAVGGLSRK